MSQYSLATPDPEEDIPMLEPQPEQQKPDLTTPPEKTLPAEIKPEIKPGGKSHSAPTSPISAEARRSRMVDTGDFQILSSLATFQLLLPTKDWSDRTWAQKRLVLCFLALLGYLALLTVIATVSGIYGQGSRTDAGSLSLKAPSLEFRLDGCFLDFYTGMEGPLFPADEVQVVVHTSGPYRWLNQIFEVEVDREAGLVSVQDIRGMDLRYSDSECAVKVFVPAGAELPDLKVTFMGYKNSQVTGADLDLRNNTLSFGVQNPLQVSSQVQLKGPTMGRLEVFMNRGSVKLVDAVVRHSAEVVLGEGSFFLRTNHSVVLNATTFAASNICLSGKEVSCVDETCTLTSSVASPAPQVTVRSYVPATTQSFTPAMGYIQVSVLSPDAYEVYPSRSLAIGFSAYDLELIKSTAALNPDVLEIRISGPGFPPSVWQNTNTFFYISLAPAYLAVFTWRILNPRVISTSATLQASFCPGLEGSDQSFENIITTGSLLRTSLGTSAKAYFVLQQDDSSLLWQEGVSLYRDFASGSYFLKTVSASNNDTVVLTIAFNVAVSVVVSLYFMFVLVRKIANWRAASLEEWGLSRFEEAEWNKRREEIYDRAGMFFLAESMVGFPSGQSWYWKIILTVFVHLLMIIIPTVPILIAAVLYQVSATQAMSEYLRFYLCGSGFDVNCTNILALPSSVIPIILYLAVLVSVFYGLISLMLYYLELMHLPWVRIVRKGYTLVVVVTSIFSVAYLVNVSFWIILGCILSPNTILPISAIVLVLMFHLVSTVARVRTLSQQLYRKIDENQEAVDAEPPSAEQFSISDVSKFSTKDVLTIVKKSRILEITGLSIWEKIVQEVVVFLIMILFFAFLCAGFLALTPSSQFVSALTTGIVFLVGGGVNIPLSSQYVSEEERRKWLENIRTQAKNDATPKKPEEEKKKD